MKSLRLQKQASLKLSIENLKMTKGTKTNFGSVVKIDIEKEQIEFTSPAAGKNILSFYQRRFGSRDYVLDSLQLVK